MRRIAGGARVVAQKAWWWLRQVSGDAAYENYLRWASRAPATAGGDVEAFHPVGVAGVRRAVRCGDNSAAVLSPEGFYLDKLKRKYARVSRCC